MRKVLDTMEYKTNNETTGWAAVSPCIRLFANAVQLVVFLLEYSL